MYYLETIPNSGNTGQFVYLSSGQDSFTFGAQSCANAYIHMHQSSESRSVYMLAIGAENNQWTQLFKYGQMIYNVTSSDILHCLQSKTFWLSWAGGKIELALEVCIFHYLVWECKFLRFVRILIKITFIVVCSREKTF